MNKVILLGASWCPITKQTKELFEELKAEMGFNYEYIDIDSDKGKELVKKFNVTDVPKIIYQGKIIFHGLPPKDKLLALSFLKKTARTPIPEIKKAEENYYNVLKNPKIYE